MIDKHRHIFNQLFLFFTILWPIVQNIVLHGIDGAGRLTVIMFFLTIIVNNKYLLQVPRSFLITVVWAFYAALNTYFSGHKGIEVFYPIWAIKNLFLPVLVMYVTYLEFKKNWGKSIKLMFICLLIFFLVGALNLRPTLQDDLSIRIMNALGNDYFNTLFMLICIVFILMAGKRLGFLPSIIIILLAFSIVIFGAERKAFGALIISTGFGIASMTVRSKHKFFILFLTVILCVLTTYFISYYTYIGERFSLLEEEEFVQNNLFLQLMGDRGIQYIQSWDMFISHPINGIGLFGYSVHNTHFIGLPLHSEYMVQLAECGMIGALLKLVALICLFKQFFHFRKFNSSPCNIILLGGIFAILFIGFTAWTYDMNIKYILFAMVYAYNLKRQRHTLNFDNVRTIQ